MTESDQGQNAEQRYEILQDLCKQQMLINEALKTELARLGELYQKASNERSLLLNELLENHSSCTTAVFGSEASDYIVPCFPKKRSMTDSMTEVPRKTQVMSLSPDIKPLVALQPSKSPESGLRVEDSMGCESDIWMGQDSCIVSDQREKAPAIVPSATVPMRSSVSRLKNLAAHLNSPPSLTVKDPQSNANSSWQHPYNSPGSPPALAVPTSSPANPVTARSLKAASLVTSSSVSSGSNIPFVPFSGQKASTTGLQGMKSISFPSRTVCGPQGSSLSRPNAPISVVLNTNASCSSGQATLLGTRVQSSPQGSTSLRLACSTSGQRILIQPTGTNTRPVVVQPTENHSSGVTGSSQ